MPYTIELTNATISSIRAEELNNQTADSFDFTAKEEKQQVGLLLPAVQAAREAARDEGADGEDLLIVNNGDGSDFDNAGLRSDGELVQAVSDGDAGYADFLF